MNQSLSRRSLLSGIGLATGAAALGVAMPAGGSSAQPDERSALSLPMAPVMQGSVSAFLPTAGLAYDVIDPTSFVGGTGTRAIVPNGVSLPSASGTSLFAPVNLSLGARLKEVRVLYAAPATPPTPVAQVLTMTPGGAITPVAFSGALPGGDGGFEHLFSFDQVIDGSVSYMVQFGAQAPGHVVQGMRVGYQPVRTGFFASTPIRRVLDTRISGAKVQGGEQRVVATGVPAGATAAVINITITETEQAGYLAAFPADAAWSGSSNINWSASFQSVANSAIVGTDSSGNIRILVGVNATHVIIDVQGYFM